MYIVSIYIHISTDKYYIMSVHCCCAEKHKPSNLFFTLLTFRWKYMEIDRDVR